MVLFRPDLRRRAEPPGRTVDVVGTGAPANARALGAASHAIKLQGAGRTKGARRSSVVVRDGDEPAAVADARQGVARLVYARTVPGRSADRDRPIVRGVVDDFNLRAVHAKAGGSNFVSEPVEGPVVSTTSDLLVAPGSLAMADRPECRVRRRAFLTRRRGARRACCAGSASRPASARRVSATGRVHLPPPDLNSCRRSISCSPSGAFLFGVHLIGKRAGARPAHPGSAAWRSSRSACASAVRVQHRGPPRASALQPDRLLPMTFLGGCLLSAHRGGPEPIRVDRAHFPAADVTSPEGPAGTWRCAGPLRSPRPLPNLGVARALRGCTCRPLALRLFRWQTVDPLDGVAYTPARRLTAAAGRSRGARGPVWPRSSSPLRGPSRR